MWRFDGPPVGMFSGGYPVEEYKIEAVLNQIQSVYSFQRPAVYKALYNAILSAFDRMTVFWGGSTTKANRYLAITCNCCTATAVLNYGSGMKDEEITESIVAFLKFLRHSPMETDDVLKIHLCIGLSAGKYQRIVGN